MSKKEKVIPKEGMICPHCGILLLKVVKSSKPLWYMKKNKKVMCEQEPDYLQCDYCDSTYVIED